MSTPHVSRDELPERRRIDAEFAADVRAGRVPELQPDPLDPGSDPFGTGYAWLAAPERPFDAAAGSLIHLPAADWYRVGGSDLRAAALGDTLASGPDEQIFRQWAETHFVAMCVADGEDGLVLVQTLRTDPEPALDTLYRVAVVLERHPRFAALGLEQRVAGALIVTAALKPDRG
ncbi:MAG: hypothetical protein U0871_00950 [Gemmataceae bacterium]